MPHRANSSTRHGHTMMPRKMVGGTLTMFDSRSSLPILRAWSVQDGTKNGTDHLDHMHTHAPRTSTHLLNATSERTMYNTLVTTISTVRVVHRAS